MARVPSLGEGPEPASPPEIDTTEEPGPRDVDQPFDGLGPLSELLNRLIADDEDEPGRES